jgi:FAD/FMN-containing dehydrogenase
MAPSHTPPEVGELEKEGTLKRSLFLETKTETELALMRGIKRVFDPHGILNPGTIL